MRQANRPCCLHPEAVVDKLPNRVADPLTPPIEHLRDLVRGKWPGSDRERREKRPTVAVQRPKAVRDELPAFARGAALGERFQPEGRALRVAPDRLRRRIIERFIGISLVVVGRSRSKARSDDVVGLLQVLDARG